MIRLAVIGACLFAVAWVATPARAQYADGLAAYGECLALADAAFETQFAGNPPEDQIGPFRTVAYNGPSACGTIHFVLCSDPDSYVPCVAAAAEDMRTRRLRILSDLPASIGDDAEASIYAQYFARFAQDDPWAPCQGGDWADRQEECAFLVEQDLESILFNAWRMARVAGAAPLVGYDPIDLPEGTDVLGWFMNEVATLREAVAP
ncbi:MAG: hypothetical protein AAF376_07215 [Pseudomonadota bacterium]